MATHKPVNPVPGNGQSRRPNLVPYLTPLIKIHSSPEESVNENKRKEKPVVMVFTYNHSTCEVEACTEIFATVSLRPVWAT